MDTVFRSLGYILIGVAGALKMLFMLASRHSLSADETSWFTTLIWLIPVGLAGVCFFAAQTMST